AQLLEIEAIAGADKRLEQTVHVPPGVELIGTAKQVIQDEGGTQLARVRLGIASDAQVGLAAPRHRLEVAAQRRRVLVAARGLKLREVHLAITAEEGELLNGEGRTGIEGSPYALVLPQGRRHRGAGEQRARHRKEIVGVRHAVGEYTAAVVAVRVGDVSGHA